MDEFASQVRNELYFLEGEENFQDQGATAVFWDSRASLGFPSWAEQREPETVLRMSDIPLLRRTLKYFPEGQIKG